MQVAHRVLPRAHAAKRGVLRSQPPRYSLSRLGPRRAEQTRTASLARTRRGRRHTGAPGPGTARRPRPPRPPVVQPPQAEVIERGGSLRAEARGDDAAMHERQCEKRRGRDREPPGGQDVPAPRQPGDRGRGGNRRRARMRHPAIKAGRAGSRGLPLPRGGARILARPGLPVHWRKYSSQAQGRA
ncbi:MAG: hypothetical protein MZV64_28135 [Ignavibacteriales bacterium]|nr:hypothetical protein [Ignavibacteriales bacterium]